MYLEKEYSFLNSNQYKMYYYDGYISAQNITI